MPRPLALFSALLVFACSLLLAAAPLYALQLPAPAPAPVPVPTPTVTSPSPRCVRTWVGRQPEFEEFMRNAPIERVEAVPVGVTKPRRAFFKANGLCGSIAWKVLPSGRPLGHWESYKSEIAAYELDKLLGLDMVPPVVEKKWRGETGAAVLWLEPVRTWTSAQKEQTPAHWGEQAVRMKMFDNLIGNIDRNAGNLLIDGEWHLFLIDHSRAFTNTRRLPFLMAHIDKTLWDRMERLDEATVTTAIGAWVEKDGIRALLARRDKMRDVIDKLLQRSGAAAVYIK